MDKIAFDLTIEQVKEIIESLNKTQDDLYNRQILAKVSGDNDLRNNLLEKLMRIQYLLPMFELELQNAEKCLK